MAHEVGSADNEEFWRQAREALRLHPAALDDDPVWDNAVWDGLDDD